jgi:ketosteroid isomerase-like protein
VRATRGLHDAAMSKSASSAVSVTLALSTLVVAGAVSGCKGLAAGTSSAPTAPTAPAMLPAPDSTEQRTTEQRAEIAAIQRVLDAQQAAWNRGDVETYMAAGYWQSPQLVFLSGGTVTRGYQPVLERYKARYQGEGKEMGQLTFSETEIELWTWEFALARGRWDLTMKDGKRVGGRYSLALAKIAPGWRIVQDHSSID